MYAPSTPVDVAVSLIAHSAVSPVRAAQARRSAAWMLGGPPARHTPAQGTAELAAQLCCTLPPPASLLAAADVLGAVALADDGDEPVRHLVQVSCEREERSDLLPPALSQILIVRGGPG
ncbi:MAG: hypothetical protein ACR2JO_03210 [Mycobacteriales bacterium]